MDNQTTAGRTCPCPHHSLFGVLVVVFGLVFLLGTLDVIAAGVVDVIWPILIIVGGGIMLMDRKCKCC